MKPLYWNTVTNTLRQVLEKLMAEPLFALFRLVGGTALSLQLGHRLSVDLDLFTDAPYDSLDFQTLDMYLREQYPYVSKPIPDIIGMGRSYILGNNPEEAVKIDLYYTDTFIREVMNFDGLRLATSEEITAMKMDIIQRKGRKKDFWDLHALLDLYTIKQMLALHEERYPYAHDRALILQNLTDFTRADEDFDPHCLLGKHWEMIKWEIAGTLAAD